MEDQSITSSEPENRKPWAPPWLIENIAEASRRASRVFALFFGSCTFGLLTMAGTSDRQLALNEPLRLPLLSTGIEFWRFLLLFPVATLAIFLWLQVYLFRLKGLVTEYRTRYAPERPRRLHPWLLTIAEDAEPHFAGKAQRVIAKALIWMPLPMLMIFTALWVVKKHDSLYSWLFGAAPVLAMLIVLHFWWQFDSPHEWEGRSFGRGWFGRHWGKLLITVIVIVREAAWLLLFVPLAHAGWPAGENEPSWAAAVRGLRPLFVYDLSYQRLTGETPRDGSATRCNLRNTHLEGANLSSSNLRKADLRNAFLAEANLERAILDEADLQNADITFANAAQASFKGASLLQASLDHTKLREADLSQARLAGASFEGAEFVRVNFKGADLRGAHGLSVGRLSQCLSLSGTVMDTTLYNALRRTHPDLLDLPRQTADSVRAD